MQQVAFLCSIDLELEVLGLSLDCSTFQVKVDIDGLFFLGLNTFFSWEWSFSEYASKSEVCRHWTLPKSTLAQHFSLCVMTSSFG